MLDLTDELHRINEQAARLIHGKGSLKHLIALSCWAFHVPSWVGSLE